MQIKQLGEPIEVRITEWNTGGLLTRIEVGIGFYFATRCQNMVHTDLQIYNCIGFQGLRAFLPKVELVDRVYSFTDLKEKVKYNLRLLNFKHHDLLNVSNVNEVSGSVAN